MCGEEEFVLTPQKNRIFYHTMKGLHWNLVQNAQGFFSAYYFSTVLGSKPFICGFQWIRDWNQTSKKGTTYKVLFTTNK